jgi:hypothetical protein
VFLLIERKSLRLLNDIKIEKALATPWLIANHEQIKQTVYRTISSPFGLSFMLQINVCVIFLLKSFVISFFF